MATVFQRIGKNITLSQEIEQKIEDAILQKEFSPGEKLPTEKELCEMFGVSRTALREALQMLSSRGLIYVKKGSGIYVEDYSPSHVNRPMHLYLELNLDKNYMRHIIEVRKMFEPQMARLAARKRSEEDVIAMQQNINELKRCSRSDFKKEGQLDRDFHLLIARSTKNPMVHLIVEPIFQIMPKIRILIYAEVEMAKSSALKYHAKIFESIKAQDEECTFKLMTEHLKIAEKHTNLVVNKL